MKRLRVQGALAALLGLVLTGVSVSGQTVSGKAAPLVPDAEGWYALFDGKTLSGWLTFDPHAWKVTPEGMIEGTGPRSHLFSPGTYRNMEFRAEIKLNHKGNSGMYFRTALGEGWPSGYESQVENTSPDPQRTGSLYNFVKIGKQLVDDDTWWTQHIVAIGNRIIIKVNDEIVVDFVDEKNTYTQGHLALQQHDPGSVVLYKNVAVKPLPDDPKAALAIVRGDLPGLK